MKGCTCAILKVNKIIYDITLGYFQNHDVTKTGLTLYKRPDKIGQELFINFHQSQINIPSIKTIGKKSKQ